MVLCLPAVLPLQGTTAHASVCTGEPPAPIVVTGVIYSCHVDDQQITVNGTTVAMPSVNEAVGTEGFATTGASILTVERQSDVIDIIWEATYLLGDSFRESDLNEGSNESNVVDGTGDKPYETPDDAAADSPTALPPCSDNHYNPHGFKESDDHFWEYNNSQRSSRWLGPRYDAIDVTNSIRNLLNGRNSCDLATGSFSARATYGFGTTRQANIHASGCADRDSHNVVSWGYQNSREDGSAVLARTCWWYIFRELREADIEINNRAIILWFSNKRSSCRTAYDLEGVMTHEWGHAYGFGHSEPESLHGNLTMSPRLSPCKTGQRTLGWGDWRGMDQKY